MKIIKLTKNREALIDDEDFKMISKNKWYAHGLGDWVYAYRRITIKKGKSKLIAMSRQILNIIDNNYVVDHINGNTLDNRRRNLRIATHSQNMANRRKKVRKTSMYKGVSLYKKDATKPWIVFIKVNRKTKYVGLYKTEREAAEVYNQNALRMYNQYAKINKV